MFFFSVIGAIYKCDMMMMMIMKFVIQNSSSSSRDPILLSFRLNVIILLHDDFRGSAYF